MRRFCLTAVLVLLAAPAVLDAQTTPAQKEVYAVVEKFFEGFNAKDTTVMRSTLFEDVKLFTTATNAKGELIARSEPASQLMAAIAGAQVKLFEKLFEPVIEVEDGLANVWVRYEFYADDKYSHCGVDSMLLVKTSAGWKIATLADTRRKTCEKK